MVYEDDRLEHFDPDDYADVLGALLAERGPLLVLLGHTAWSMDFAPALAVRTGHPLATDCVDVLLDGPAVKVVRQVYSGKMFARSAFRSAGSYLVTVRPGAFPVGTTSGRQTTIPREGSADRLTAEAGSRSHPPAAGATAEMVVARLGLKEVAQVSTGGMRPLLGRR